MCLLLHGEMIKVFKRHRSGAYRLPFASKRHHRLLGYQVGTRVTEWDFLPSGHIAALQARRGVQQWLIKRVRNDVKGALPSRRGSF